MDKEKRKRIGIEAGEILERAKINMRVLAEDLGVAYGTLTVAFSAGGDRLPVEDDLKRVAGALDRKAERLPGIAQELRRLAEEAEEEE